MLLKFSGDLKRCCLFMVQEVGTKIAFESTINFDNAFVCDMNVKMHLLLTFCFDNSIVKAHLLLHKMNIFLPH